MNKKIIFVVTLFLVSAAVGFVFLQNSFKSPSSLKVNTAIKPTSQSQVLGASQKYNDPAGFTFNYPDSITIMPKKIIDDTIYSSLEVNSATPPGKITIQAVASNLLSLDDEPPRKTKVAAVKFADLSAKQYTEKGNLITLALDKGVLFTITVTATAPENMSFWRKVNNQILSSFAFTIPSTTAVESNSTASTTEEDVSFEGEEVIE